MNIRYPLYEGVYRILTLEKALLHCLNGFNENATIKDRYRSIGEYLLQK